jgi:hypothetical protein
MRVATTNNLVKQLNFYIHLAFIYHAFMGLRYMVMYGAGIWWIQWPIQHTTMADPKTGVLHHAGSTFAIMFAKEHSKRELEVTLRKQCRSTTMASMCMCYNPDTRNSKRVANSSNISIQFFAQNDLRKHLAIRHKVMEHLIWYSPFMVVSKY